MLFFLLRKAIARASSWVEKQSKPQNRFLSAKFEIGDLFRQKTKFVSEIKSRAFKLINRKPDLKKHVAEKTTRTDDSSGSKTVTLGSLYLNCPNFVRVARKLSYESASISVGSTLVQILGLI